MVAAGAILIDALRQKGVLIGTHLARVGGVADRGFEDLKKDIESVNGKLFAVLDETKVEAMQQAILSAKVDGDSVGGVLESAIVGLPAGVGEPFFDSLESRLAHALFSIPAVKGVEFGDGFALADMRGSQSNDAMQAAEGGAVLQSGHAGGIFGGISVGAPIVCARR